MLIARAPLRISLAGGGTDLPAFYEPLGGLVVSTSIDKYVYVQVSANRDGSARVTSADYHTFYHHLLGTPMTWDGDLALPRAVLHEFGVDRDISVFTSSEVPPGTGLGSSGALASALILGIATYLGRSMSPQDVAELACDVEMRKLGAPVGKQDQFAAAFGGLNTIRFERSGTTVEPLQTPPGTIERLESRLLLFFTGTARDSATILREQQRATRDGGSATLDALHRIKAAAQYCRACLEAGNTDTIGELLHDGWEQKRKVAPGVTNQRIDEVYAEARRYGAVGGKILGAGGGGFLLVYCPSEHQATLTGALEKLGLRRMEFHFTRSGVEVVTVGWTEDPGAEKLAIRASRRRGELAR
jgi:D-glycero-alpha-D-manno-heptose-7-phosphate kinase